MRLMDQIEYRAAQAALKLTDPRMAKLLGVSLRTANGYANGGAIPSPVRKLIRLIRVMHLSVEDVPD
ncbi:DNA-binding transcriptional regulator YiaG [Bradyrhizobium sp. RT10b]